MGSSATHGSNYKGDRAMSYDDEILGDEELINKYHRQYVEKKLKKKPIKNIHDKITRARKENYDPNPSGKPASGIPAKGGPNGTYPGVMRKYTTIQPFPESIEEQNAFIDQLPGWLEENPHELMLVQFPLSFGYSPYEFFNYAKSGKNPHFTRFVQAARQIIAARVNNHLLEDPTHLRHLFHLNHDESREWELEKRAVSKPDMISSQEKIQVVMEQFPESALVAVKKKEEK